MLAYAQRLLLAAMVSASGIIATLSWYRWATPKDFVDTTQPAVARLKKSTQQVQRKRAKRLLWQNVNESEEFFAGESVRTSSAGGAEIEFLNVVAQIEMDPDSVVVIELNNDKPRLDFIKGNLFVKNTGEAGSELTIKSGEKELAVNGAEIALNKSAGGELQLDVLKGQVEVSEKGQKKNLNEDTQSIKVFRPSMNEVIRYLPGRDQSVGFDWQKLQQGYKVTLHSGKSRRDLSEVAGLATLSPSNSLNAQLPPGTHYVQLMASLGDGKPPLKSAVFKIQVESILPPTILEPAPDTQIKVGEKPLQIKWTNPSRLKNLKYEIAQDPSFKKLLKQELTSESGSMNINIEKEGKYYLRFHGLTEDDDLQISSSIRSFTMLKEEKKPLVLNLQLPVANAEIKFQDFELGPLQLNWDQLPEATSYRLELRPLKEDRSPASEKAFEYNPKNALLKLKLLAPGRYTWRVAALDKSNKELIATESREFKILPPPEILPPQFADNTPEEIAAARDGSASVAWKPSEGATSYVVNLQRDGSSPQSIRTASTSTDFKKLMPGDYTVVLQSIDKNGKPSKPGEKKTIRVPNTSNAKPPKLKKVQVD